MAKETEAKEEKPTLTPEQLKEADSILRKMRWRKPDTKTGPPSDKEREYLMENCFTMTEKELAKNLNRSIKWIRKNLPEIQKKATYTTYKDEKEIQQEIKKNIETTETWAVITREFTEDEMRLFKEKYKYFYSQFKGDLTPIEENQIMQVVKQEVLMSRELIDRRTISESILELEQEYREMKNIPREDLTDEDRERKGQIQELLSSYRASKQNAYNAYIKFQEKQQALVRDLKSTRDQRINKVDDTKNVSWIDVLKKLGSDKEKDMIGMAMEVGKKSYESEKERMSKEHQFTNGQPGKLLFNSETVGDDDGQDEVDNGEDS